MFYQIAKEILNGRERRKYDHNTYFEVLDDATIGVRLHNTHIIRIHADNTIQIYMYEWNTVTTRSRINSVLRKMYDNFFPGIFTVKGNPFFKQSNGSSIEFFDGMRLNTKGMCINYWNRG